MQTIGSIDFAIIIGYLTMLTLVGAWFVRKGKTSTDYYLAGRQGFKIGD
jgi:Na+/proline symporter